MIITFRVCCLATITHSEMDPTSAGPLYCREQIRIPPGLPDILKDFTKAAIRTQPADPLEWAAAYFQALAEGGVPPVKERVELCVGGLSRGSLSVLHRQLCSHSTVPEMELRNKWKEIGLSQPKLEELLSLGGLEGEEVEWIKVLALSCTALEKNLPSALKTLCEIVSPDDDGGPARIPVAQFGSVYSFLAAVDGEIAEEQVTRAMEWLNTEADRFEGRVGPREFLHPSCPCLDMTSQ